MIVSVTEDSKLKTYLSAIRKQQKYVDTFSPVYCTDTIEELKIYFDRILEEYYLNTNE